MKSDQELVDQCRVEAEERYPVDPAWSSPDDPRIVHNQWRREAYAEALYSERKKRPRPTGGGGGSTFHVGNE